MPLLYLVRHAIAEDRDPERWPDDALRPLSPRGVRRFIEAARGLRALGLTVDVALASPYLRAQQTAALLRTHAGWPAAIEASAFASGNITAEVAVLRATDAAAVGVVGHEPDLSRLAAWLLTGNDGGVGFDWRRGGVAVLELTELSAGGARLLAYLPGRVLRR